MAEQRWRPSDADLEQELLALGRQVAFPPTPSLAPRVRAQLAARPALLPWWRHPAPRRIALGLIAMVVLCLVVLAAWPAARTAVAGRLGLPGISIHQAPSVPKPPTATPPLAQSLSTGTPPTSEAIATPGGTTVPKAPTAPPPLLSTATPPAVGARLALGDQVSLAQVQQRVGFRPLLPEGLGQPDAVYVATPPPSGAVTLVYRPRPGLPATTETGVGLLLTEFRGATDAGFLMKVVGPDTRVEAVTVNGAPGFWLEGAPHALAYRDPSGQFETATLRLAGNTLAWNQGDLTLRIESALTKEEALKIASSVR